MVSPLKCDVLSDNSGTMYAKNRLDWNTLIEDIGRI